MFVEYTKVNGTSYNIETNEEVIKVLEQCRKDKTRIVLDYGDPKTGESWGETFDIIGYVGRSMGSVKVPLLLYNNRSVGGGEILTHRIIGIKTSNGKKELYKLKL